MPLTVDALVDQRTGVALDGRHLLGKGKGIGGERRPQLLALYDHPRVRKERVVLHVVLVEVRVDDLVDAGRIAELERELEAAQGELQVSIQNEETSMFALSSISVTRQTRGPSPGTSSQLDIVSPAPSWALRLRSTASSRPAPALGENVSIRTATV